MKSQNCCSEIEAGEIMEWKETAARVMMIAPEIIVAYMITSPLFSFSFSTPVSSILFMNDSFMPILSVHSRFPIIST